MTYIFSAIIIYIFIGLCLFVLQRRILFNTSGHPGSPKSYNLNNIKEIKERLKGWQLESFEESYEHKIKNGISLFKKNLKKDN